MLYGLGLQERLQSRRRDGSTDRKNARTSTIRGETDARTYLYSPSYILVEVWHEHLQSKRRDGCTRLNLMTSVMQCCDFQVLGLCQQERLQSLGRDGSTDPSAWLMSAGTSTIPGERRIHGPCDLKRTSTILKERLMPQFVRMERTSQSRGETDESNLLCSLKSCMV
jgi:hypothetical protein